MKIVLYANKNKAMYVLLTIGFGVIVFFGLLNLGIHYLVSILAGLYWLFLTFRVLIKTIIFIEPNNAELEVRKSLLGVPLGVSVKKLSQYYGVRNRIQFGHFKHCYTELLGHHGEYFPIRIELLTDKISEEAGELKMDVAGIAGLEFSPDIDMV